MARKRASSGLDGILLVDKPAGWTSHDVVAKVRRLSGQPRAGHTGTLDPFATGLLVVCLGRATRLAEYLTAHEKAYEAEAVLGVETDTDDSDGRVTRRDAVPTLDRARLSELEQQFTGRIRQVPPAYSALSIGGERAYALARRGEAVALAARAVEVLALSLELVGADRLRMHVQCGPGTYIRSLARDIGRELGCGAHLVSLRRLRSGCFDVAAAWPMVKLEELAGAGRLAEALLPADEGLQEWDAAILGERGMAAFGRGNRYRARSCTRAAELARVYGADGSFLGVGTVDTTGTVQPVKVLAG
ncbi:MAG: tRNA pseudouridine synthase B [Tepidiforma sp.]|nr:MAG: tRNA pseudouridine synthase B [Tepidiforma sp.]